MGMESRTRLLGQSAEALDSRWTCAASYPWQSPPPPPSPHLVHLAPPSPHLHLAPHLALRQQRDILQSATCTSWLHRHLSGAFSRWCWSWPPPRRSSRCSPPAT